MGDGALCRARLVVLFCTRLWVLRTPAMEIPFGLQAVKILSLFEFIVTEERSNFRDTVSSRPETSL